MNRDMDKFDKIYTPKSASRTTIRAEAPKLIANNEFPSPSSSPRRRNKPVFSDRYIPNRTGIDLQAAFSLTNEDIIPDLYMNKIVDNELDYRREEEANRTFSTVLKAELFGDNVPLATANLNNLNQTKTNSRPSTASSGTTSTYSSNSQNNSNHNSNGSNQLRRTPPRTSTSNQNNSNITSTPRQSANLFTFQSPSKSRPSSSRDIQNELFSLSPVRPDSQRLLLSPQKKPRSISKVPYRVLDAPELLDDFYLNLVDWGSQDILGVGLGSCVYLWDASSGSVNKLCDLGPDDKVTSISWIGSGTHIAVGTNSGLVEIWDASVAKCTRTMTGHSLRTGSLAWNEHVLTSGSRDRSILHRDVRDSSHYIKRLECHKQEVCGLKWNIEENKLASGGNDNKLFVWDGLNERPLYKFQEHTAAVKAIAWSPHQRGILASGGGTADKSIKTWNTTTGLKVHDVDTGSQVCNLVWSKNSNEIVSTHGYSRNQIMVWKYPSMQQVASLTGHTYRVLYLALSPDGQTIVTGAGDETLRFWNVFDKNKSEQGPPSVLLDAFMQLR